MLSLSGSDVSGLRLENIFCYYWDRGLQSGLNKLSADHTQNSAILCMTFNHIFNKIWIPTSQ